MRLQGLAGIFCHFADAGESLEDDPDQDEKRRQLRGAQFA